MEHKTTEQDIERFAIQGREINLHGLDLAINFLTALRDEMRREIAEYEAGSTASVKAKRGRPANLPPKAERLIQGLTTRGKPLKGHPREPNHPDHAEWLAKIKKAKANRKTGSKMKGYWAGLTPEQRRKEVQRRLAMRKPKPTVVLERKGAA